MASLQHSVGADCGNAIQSTLCVSGVQRFNNFTAPANRSLANLNGQIEHYPGIITEKPKHPDYAIKSVRQLSFSDWCSNVMDPVQLAEAGFFYTGIKGCVRCFFCGGCMKNWETGDNAWIEHARWFPNCAYVRLSKGEDFVNMCIMANIGAVSNEQVLQNQELLGGSIENRGHIVEDQLIEDLNSTAAKLVMNMGYGQQNVESAVKSARQKHGTGTTELRAQYILEFLIDNNYTPNSPMGTNETERSENTTPLQISTSAASSQEPSESSALQRRLDYVPEDDGINEETKHLLDENRALKQQMTCKVCMDRDACIVFIPCGHMVACVECALALRKCAVCRSNIEGTVRAYPS